MKSLASKPQKMPILGSRTAIFFELLKFCSLPEKKFEDVFFGDRLNLDCKTDSICVKTDQNLGEDRLILFPASELAPDCKFLAMRLPGSHISTYQ